MRREILRRRQPVVAVLDQGEGGIAREFFDQFQRVLPGHVGILHALDDVRGRVDGDGGAEQEMAAAVLDQRAGDRIGTVAIGRRTLPFAALHDLAADVGRHALPDQRLGEIGRGREQKQGCDVLGTRPRREQRDPGAHAGADENLRAIAQSVQHRERIVAPARDRAVAERARRGAVAEIVEAQIGVAARLGPGIERLGLGAVHVGVESAEPNDTRTLPAAPQIGDGLAVLADESL